MNRFIDLRHQGVCARFAFFSTVNGKFVTVLDTQTWDTFDEFAEAVTSHEQLLSDKEHTQYVIDNFKQLCPMWVFDVPTEDELDC